MHPLGIMTRKQAAGGSAEHSFCPVLLIRWRGINPLQVLLKIEVPLLAIILEDCVAAQQIQQDVLQMPSQHGCRRWMWRHELTGRVPGS
jgi:hypothetical protein